MGKLIQGILDSLKLTDEDDFDDDEPVVTRREPARAERKAEETAAAKEQPQPQAPKRFEGRPLRSTQKAYEEQEYTAPRRESRSERQPVPMRSASHGLEVIIRQPNTFDDSQEICDYLKSGHAIIINLENVDRALAQKMMDFISGAIYALDAKIHQISGCVFCISPASVDISGDYFTMLSENNGFQIPDVLKK